MITAGVFTNGRETAAAVAVDGRLRSALNLKGGAEGDLLAKCLELARVAPSDVTTIVRVADGLPEKSPDQIGRLQAQAALLSAVVPENALLLLLDAGCAGGAFATKRDGQLEPLEKWPGSADLVGVVRSTASVLGISTGNPFVSLSRIAGDTASDLDERLSEARLDNADGSVGVDAVRFGAVLSALTSECPEIGRADSLKIAVQRARASLATATLRLVTHAVVDSIERIRSGRESNAVGLGGSAFAAVGFTTGITSRVSPVAVTPVPEDVGCALGAALHGQPAVPVTHLSLGPTFDEHDIKSALENCRLDYVYEPDWPRLFDRVSGILTAGKTVAWFQGASEFGPRPLGHRSILCDPSSRYARENVNVYLLAREVDRPLPVSLAPSAVGSCLEVAVHSPYMLVNGRVASGWKDQLQAAIDSDGKAVIHTPSHDSELAKLLEAHFRRRGVPGLIHVPLAGVGTWLASDPKDAIRTAFGSAVDALVIGRFLVSKDYWLLRGQTTA